MVKIASGATRVIGIDPGLNLTGYGVIECLGNDVRLLEAGVIRLPRSEGNNLAIRLESLFSELREVIDDFHPETMCLEEVYSHADYPRTAILMGHARGVICLAARLAKIPVHSFSARRIRAAAFPFAPSSASGGRSGRAGRGDVLRQRRAPAEMMT